MGWPSKLGFSEKGKNSKKGKIAELRYFTKKVLETSLIRADSSSAFQHNVLSVWENL